MESAWKHHMPSRSLGRAGGEPSGVHSRQVTAEWPNCLCCCLSRPANLPSPSSSLRSTDSLVRAGLTLPSDPGSSLVSGLPLCPIETSSKCHCCSVMVLSLTTKCLTLILENPELYSTDLLYIIKQCLLNGIQGTSALRQWYTSSDYVTQKCLGSMMTKEKEYFGLLSVIPPQSLTSASLRTSGGIHTAKNSRGDKYRKKSGKKTNCSISKIILTHTVLRRAHCSLPWILGLGYIIPHSWDSPYFLFLPHPYACVMNLPATQGTEASSTLPRWALARSGSTPCGAGGNTSLSLPNTQGQHGAPQCSNPV